MFTVQRPIPTAVFVYIVVSAHACTLFAMRSWSPTGARNLTHPQPHTFSPRMFRIDQKVSSSPSGYKLQDPQAILNEVRSIRDAINSGEREKQELMQVGAGVVTLVTQVAHTIFYILKRREN